MSIRTIAATLLAASALAACASFTKTYTADGREGYSLNCSGTGRNWGMCEQKAGDICGARGYEILSRSGEQGAVSSFGPSGGFAGSTFSRSMMIACKG